VAHPSHTHPTKSIKTAGQRQKPSSSSGNPTTFDLIHPHCKTVRGKAEENGGAWLRAIFDSVPAGIIIIDPDRHVIVDINPAAANMFGEGQKNIIGSVCHKYICPAEVGQCPITDLHKKVDNAERVLLRAGGGTCPVIKTVTSVSIDGQAFLVESIMDITQRKRAEEQLVHDALYDNLTGLPNRALFMDRLGHALKRANRAENHGCAVIFLDLDRFKVVNDSLGHLVGDSLLKETARRLEGCVRPGDTVARLGGDEFVMLFEDVREVNAAKAIADRIQEVLSAPFLVGGSEIRSSASIGIALTSKEYQLPEEVLRDADITMYRAKALGKARCEVFDPAMRLEAAALLQLENDLRRALSMNELRIHYQPIVTLSDEKIVGFEALLRWQHPRRGLVRPEEFIPLAEETGLIIPIGEWVLRNACMQMKKWRDRGVEAMRMAVNISAVQLRQADFVDLLEGIVQETGMEPHLLDLEITESALMDRTAPLIETFARLRGRGVRICLDDFGTGYSSLSYLQGLPIGVLKIDRSFTINLQSAKENSKIIETILMLGKNLGAEVIAEGIETRAQLDYLKAIDCARGQGFFFSKPLDDKTLEAFIGIADKA